MKFAPVAALVIAACSQVLAGCRWSSDPSSQSTANSPTSSAVVGTAGTAGTAGTIGTVGTAGPRTDGGAPPNGGTSGIIASGGSQPTSGGTTPVSSPPATGPGVTVAWQAPTYNEDGTPLLDLAGFRIRHGSRYGSYTAEISVDNPGATSHVIRGLAPGLHYVIVSAVNRQGLEGTPSRPQRIQVL